MEYRIVLKDNNKRAFLLFGWFLYCLHLVAGGLGALQTSAKTTLIANYIFICLYILILLLHLFKVKGIALFNSFRFLLYGIYLVFWLKQPNYLAALLLFVIVVFAEFVRTKKTSIFFEEDKISCKQIFSTKVWNWKEFENVILKDGLLTLDFSNNHLLQVEIGAESAGINEAEFNSFGSKLLTPSTPLNTK